MSSWFMVTDGCGFGAQRYAGAWMLYSSEYWPRLPISSSCVPTSTSRAPSSTTMRSAMRTVENRCETRMVMRPLADSPVPRVVGNRFSLCGSLRAAPGVPARGARLPPSRKSTKLTNPHCASRELRANLQLSTHRLDGFPQRAHKDVGAAFDLGHAGLIDAQRLCQAFLAYAHRLTKFVESHFLDHLLTLCIRACSRPLRHLCFQFSKILTHSAIPPIGAFPHFRRTPYP